MSGPAPGNATRDVAECSRVAKAQRIRGLSRRGRDAKIMAEQNATLEQPKAAEQYAIVHPRPETFYPEIRA